MAVSAGSTFEIRSTGNNNNSGAFNAAGASAGTDYTQQDAYQITIDGVTITATVHTTTTRLNVVGYTVSTADIRNSVRVTGGTAPTGLFEITGIETAAGANRWIMNQSMGTAGQTVTGGVGGGWADFSQIPTFCPTNSIIYAKGSFTLAVSIAGGGNGKRLIGYGTTRGDNNRFNVTASANVANFANFEFVWNLNWSSGGFSTTAINTLNKMARNCIISGGNIGITSSFAYARVLYCYVENTTSAGFNSSSAAGDFHRCYANNCGIGFSVQQSTISFCFANDCTTGFTISGANQASHFEFCTAYLCTNGYTVSATGQPDTFWNCLSAECTSNGFNVSSGYFDTCADFNSTAGFTGTASENLDFITLTADPFVNSAGGDFGLNDVSGGGADIKNLQWEMINLATSISYAHVGSFQPSTSAGSSRPTSGQVWPRGIITQP